MIFNILIRFDDYLDGFMGLFKVRKLYVYSLMIECWVKVYFIYIYFFWKIVKLVQLVFININRGNSLEENY